MREYESEEQFRRALEHPALELELVRSSQLKFPLTDFVLRAAAVTRVLRDDQLPELYQRGPRWLARARRAIGVPIPGYRWVEASGQKQNS
jgi:hypothetical protein